MKSFKQPLSVLVVIHTPALEVLLLERAAHPGFWQSVTGSREDGEALPDTARREVGEETGIDTTRYPPVDWQITNTFEIFAEWRHRYAPGVTQNTERFRP
jgi:dATP pyrophosphohydrolase